MFSNCILNSFCIKLLVIFPNFTKIETSPELLVKIGCLFLESYQKAIEIFCQGFFWITDLSRSAVIGIVLKSITIYFLQVLSHRLFNGKPRFILIFLGNTFPNHYFKQSERFAKTKQIPATVEQVHFQK